MTPAMRAGYSCRPLETKLMLGSHLLLHFVFCDIDAGAFLPLNHRSLVDNRPAGTQQFIQSLLTFHPIAVEEHVHKTINGLEQRKATMRTSLSFDRKHAPCTQDNSTKASITPTSENSTRTMAGASTELWRVLEKRRVRLRLTAPPSPPHYAACSPIGCN